MPVHPLYQDAYPRSGQVALLCEGDVIGYEVSILKRWLDQYLGVNPLVDFWACGTSTAIFGVSDAIGRARPIVVVEDRDYRTIEESTKESETRRQRRAERGLSILAWRSWQRNEIENYLLEPDVVAPCFAMAFKCTEANVKDTLAEILPALSVNQAFQHTFFQARQVWETSDPSPLLPNSLVLAPTWDDSVLRASSPGFQEALQVFRQNLKRWSGRLPSAIAFDSFADQACARYEQWKNPSLLDQFWLHDWAGKDVLQWLRIALTARFGWRNRATGERARVSWANLNRARRDERDRPIEADLKPFLVRAFLEFLSARTTGPLHSEWHGLLDAFSSLRGSPPATSAGK